MDKSGRTDECRTNSQTTNYNDNDGYSGGTDDNDSTGGGLCLCVYVLDAAPEKGLLPPLVEAVSRAGLGLSTHHDVLL